MNVYKYFFFFYKDCLYVLKKVLNFGMDYNLYKIVCNFF